MDVWEVPRSSRSDPDRGSTWISDRRAQSAAPRRRALFRSPGEPAGVILGGMADVTQILAAIEQGDPRAAEELLPLVYDELRQLAAARMAVEKPGQTLQATALVHE